MDAILELKIRHRRAIGLMAGAVMFFSTNALFVKLTLGDNHPFLYNAAVWLGMALGLAAVLALFPSPGLRGSHRSKGAPPAGGGTENRRGAEVGPGGDAGG